MEPIRLPSFYSILPEVIYALETGQPVVALESAVITHGLPRPQNLQLARNMEAVVRANGAIPATVALIDGKVHVGLSADQVERLSAEPNPRKISRRDFGIAIAKGECGGTTVSGTLIAARAVGIRVFATGGIGGVHRGFPFDVSADLLELGRSPLVVVCAGAKAILDLPNTLEYLETSGVPVVGYQTDEFPAFFSRESGLRLTASAQSPAEVAGIARSQWAAGIESAVVVANPPPVESALPFTMVEDIIQKALAEANQSGIHGAGVTPFLLSRLAQLSGGASLKANLALLENNARLAALIARELSTPRARLV